MSGFQVAAILLTLTAGLAYANARLLRLPSAIGMMAIALFGSLVVIGLDATGAVEFAPHIEGLLDQLDLDEALLHGMLGALLFAGALHVDLGDLKEQRWPILALSLGGTVVSTALVAAGTYVAVRLVGLPLSFVGCLLFGALISPTDPIAVLGLLRSAGAPRRLQVTITGESLFNDGVAVVVFLGVLELGAGGHIGAGAIARLFVQEVLGGVAFGLAIGYLGFRLLRSIDEYSVEVMITVAIVFGGYAAAEALHVSAPLAAVASGLLIGNHGRGLAMSDTTREHVDKFWHLIDEILNAGLFLVIGLEVVHLRVSASVAVVAATAVVIVLAARLVSVAAPLAAMPRFREQSPGALPILTWGGLRGGISVALALSLRPGPAREAILVITYVVVAFSILVQGLTVGRVIRRVVGARVASRAPFTLL